MGGMSEFPPMQFADNDATFDQWFDDSFDPELFDIDPSAFYSRNNNSCGFIPNAPNIVDEVDKSDMQRDSMGDMSPDLGLPSLTDFNMWAGETQLQTSQLLTDDREHEMSFLIRHFTEAIGPWMDLFDIDQHFGHLVPLKALRDALLRNAVAAVAAKQLGRVKGNKPFCPSQRQRPASMETMDDIVHVDWFYKAANYYDKAIACSRLYLQALSGTLNGPSTPDTQMTLSSANSDDLLVAVSIFSLYESLDNLEHGWLQHLSGLKSLLSAVAVGQSSLLGISPAVSGGHRASFWNFARADYQAAYINRTPTLLDTEDRNMWKSCGLELGEDGSLYTNPKDVSKDPGLHRPTVELVAHTLLYIVLRLVNFYASNTDTSAFDVRQEQWDTLTSQLEAWHSTLPETFQPCAQIKHPIRIKGQPTIGTQLMEVFFSIDVCAASVQLYHFARIILLLNKPVDPNVAAGSRLSAYREVSNEAIKHAHEICGIALGRPAPAVRVEMLLPLYIAGSCLESDDERRVVVELLRAIESDTGCSTEARVQDLMREWGWTATIT
ncbi:hypothetical protein MBLNU230_g2146t2 [Neophaeotheca triangularis]